MSGKPIEVVVVDDSALMRQMLTVMLEKEPDIKVVGAAPDPYAAREMIKRLNPDVLTLDVEMPKMDGLSFLEKIMTLRPMPVVMVSSLTQEGADATLQALEIGAVDFVAKPTSDIQHGMGEKRDELVTKVRAAAAARVRSKEPKGGVRVRPNIGNRIASTEKIIAIGASTGGVEAVRDIATVLPADCPAVLITQHMPVQFTASFAERLNGKCRVSVCEARDAQRVLPGHVYIAPGDRHLELAKSGANYICRLRDGETVSGHKPSVDVLFRSVAQVAGRNAIGAILTGMGKDGAQGLLEMREAGSPTFGQDEATCVVYGMPRVAFEIGAVEKQVRLSHMADAVLSACSESNVRLVRV